MTTALTITGVTRMNNSKVCISGVTNDGKYIRPVTLGGIHESWLTISEYNQMGEYEPVFLRPFSKVELELAQTEIKQPHTEDRLIVANQIGYSGLLPKDQREGFLERITDPFVADIFGANIHRHDESCYVLEGEGERSLGTVKASEIKYVSVLENGNGCKCRIRFRDGNGDYYNLPVTDLSLLNYLNHLKNIQGIACGKIGLDLKSFFNNATTYIRIGLGRGYHYNQEKDQNRCYLLISGIYTFPDYLEGRCYSDFEITPDEGGEDEIPF